MSHVDDAPVAKVLAHMILPEETKAAYRSFSLKRREQKRKQKQTDVEEFKSWRARAQSVRKLKKEMAHNRQQAELKSRHQGGIAVPKPEVINRE